MSRISGVAAPLNRADVDTDAIIPQRWLVTTQREGLGVGLFSNWRYRPGTLEPDPGFILNQPAFRNARIIVAASNYGCGSSREHAVWAHLDYGVAAVVAPSFGPIFYDNALKNGLLVVKLEEWIVETMLRGLAAARVKTMTVDLAAMSVIGPDGREYPFKMDEPRRQALLTGQDDITATLLMTCDIDAFERDDRARFPWLWPDPNRGDQGVEKTSGGHLFRQESS